MLADMVAVQMTRALPAPAVDEKARHDELEHPPTVDDARAAAAAVAERLPEVVRIGLFGSVARGDASPHSDIDLLVVMEDLDYPVDRPRLAGEVRGAARRATLYPVGVVVTDVTEWAGRSSLRTTIEREISRGLLTLYDNGDERRLSVAWEKAMEKASTDLSRCCRPAHRFDAGSAGRAIRGGSLGEPTGSGHAPGRVRGHGQGEIGLRLRYRAPPSNWAVRRPSLDLFGPPVRAAAEPPDDGGDGGDEGQERQQPARDHHRDAADGGQNREPAADRIGEAG